MSRFWPTGCSSTRPWAVSASHELTPASPRLLTPGIAAEVKATHPTDLTNNCWVIADDGTGAGTSPHIVLDLHPDRVDRYYQAFWDTYGMVDEMPVVARSLSELLERLLTTGGQSATLPGPHYGDAYQQT